MWGESENLKPVSPAFGASVGGDFVTVAGDRDSNSEDCYILVVSFLSVHRFFDVPGPIFAKLCQTTRYVLK